MDVFIKKIIFNHNDWNKIFNNESNELIKTVDAGNLIKKTLTEQTKEDGCVFAINTRKIKKRKITIYLDCAHQGCKRYALRLNINSDFMPNNNENDQFEMELYSNKSDINHSDKPRRREIKGMERSELAETAKTMLPNMLIDLQAQKADQTLVDNNNMDMIPSRSVAKAIRGQGLAANQLDPDEITALVMLSEKSDYVRSIQVFPFRVIMMSETQCSVVHKLYLATGPLDIYMDATGHITHAYNNKPSYYFACVMTVPIKTPDQKRTYVINDMVCTYQDTLTIATFLMESRHLYTKKYNENPFGTVTIDQSEASLNAIHLAFNACSAEDFNNKCFDIIKKFETTKEEAAKELLKLTRSQNCFNHLVRNMCEYLKKHFRAHEKGHCPKVSGDMELSQDEKVLITVYHNGFFYMWYLNILKLIANSSNLQHLVDVIWRNFCVLTGKKMFQSFKTYLKFKKLIKNNSILIL